MHSVMIFAWIMAVLILVFGLGIGVGGQWEPFGPLATVAGIIATFAFGFHCGIADRNLEIAKRR